MEFRQTILPPPPRTDIPASLAAFWFRAARVVHTALDRAVLAVRYSPPPEHSQEPEIYVELDTGDWTLPTVDATEEADTMIDFRGARDITWFDKRASQAGEGRGDDMRSRPTM